MSLTDLQRTFLVTNLGIQPSSRPLQLPGMSGEGDMKGVVDGYTKVENDTIARIAALRSLPGTKPLIERLETELNEIGVHVRAAYRSGGREDLETGTRLVGDLYKIAQRAVANKDFYFAYDTASEAFSAIQAHAQHAHVEYEAESAERALSFAYRLAGDGGFDEARDELSAANERLREAKRCADQYARVAPIRADGERVIGVLKKAHPDAAAYEGVVAAFEAAVRLAEPPSRRYAKARTDMQTAIDRMTALLPGDQKPNTPEP